MPEGYSEAFRYMYVCNIRICMYVRAKLLFIEAFAERKSLVSKNIMVMPLVRDSRRYVCNFS